MERIAVLAGGPSNEHDVSLQTGTEVLRCLRSGQHRARPVRISRQGSWVEGESSDDFEDLAHQPGGTVGGVLARLARGGDVAFVALHGRFGEDGQVQRLLEGAGVPYTGSRARASGLGMDKQRAKRIARRVGAMCAQHTIVQQRVVPTDHLVRSVGLPCFVKPVAGGSSVGVSQVSAARSLPSAVAAARAEDPLGRAMVERRIPGTELTCAVLRVEGKVRCLPLVAIHPEGAPFYDYQAKYLSSATRYECPASVPTEVSREIVKLSAALYRRLALRGCVRVDFIHDPGSGQVVFLELNTVPGFTSHSLVPLAAERSGLGRLALLEAVLADTEPGR